MSVKVKKIFWFLSAGGCAFVIDSSLTYFLISVLGGSPFLARIPGIACAVAFTWLVNRSRTFGPSPHSLAVEGFRYWTVGVTAMIINYGMYSMLMARIPELQPLIAIIFSSAAATLYSFFGYSRFVFRHKRSDSD